MFDVLVVHVEMSLYYLYCCNTHLFLFIKLHIAVSIGLIGAALQDLMFSFLLFEVKVLVFLTMPVEPSSEDVAQQIEYLWDLKAALTRNVAIAVIVSLLEDPLDHLET
jgi:hypothetical protein